MQQGERGLALAISKRLISTLLESDPNYIICQLTVGEAMVIVCNLYWPSGSLQHPVVLRFTRVLRELHNKFNRAKFILLGDLNRGIEEVSEWSWRLPGAIARIPARGAQGTFHGYRPTMEASAIDHILLGRPDGQWCTTVLRQWSDSDHWPLYLNLPLEFCRVPVEEGQKTLYQRKFSHRGKQVFRYSDTWNPFISLMNKGENDISEVVESFVSTLKEVGKEAKVILAASDVEPKRLPMTRKCKKAVDLRSQALNQYLATGSEVDRVFFQEKKRDAKAALKESKAQMMNKRLEELRHSLGINRMKQAWSWIKGFMRNERFSGPSSLPAIFNSEGVLQTSEEERKSAWVSYYRNLLEDSTGHSRNPVWWSQFAAAATPEPSIDLDPYDLVDVENLNRHLDALGNGKAPGLDKIPGEWLKMLFVTEEDLENHTGAGLISLNCLRRVLLEGIPECWNKAEIVSILKSGDSRLASNYRGIALIPAGLKVLCAMVATWFSNYLTEHGMLHPAQAGFRKKEECNAQTATLLEIVTRRRTLGMPTYAAFIDFKKAYDMVPHEALFAKLRWKGFGGVFMEFLQNLYATSTMQPRGADEAVPVKRGLRQGCPLSPSLFNFFINDIFDADGETGLEPPGVKVPTATLPEGTTGLWIPGLMFADDVVLLADTAEDLKASLAHVEQWANKWEMECGVNKCGIMYFAPNLELDPIAALAEVGPWQIHGRDVPLVRHYRYLGFELRDDLDMEAHYEARKTGAEKAFSAGYSFFRNRRIPLRLRAQAYKALVTPVLSWGSEHFPLDRNHFSRLCSLQDRQVKTIVGLRSSNIGCISSMERELDIVPFHIRCATARLRLFEKAGYLCTYWRVLADEEARCPPLPTRGRRPGTILTKRWLQARLRETTDRGEPRHGWIGSYLWAEKLRKCGTLASSYYIQNRFVANRVYLDVNRFDLVNEEGYLCLFRMRTGAFLTTQRLAQMRLLDPALRNHCPFCDQDVPETTQHLLMTCEEWRIDRENIVFSQNDDIYLYSESEGTTMLLGGELNHLNGEGERVGDGFLTNHDGDTIALATAQFLQLVQPRRQRRLRALMLSWPPRTNAPMGMVALDGPGMDVGAEHEPGDVQSPLGVLVGRNPTYPMIPTRV